MVLLHLSPAGRRSRGRSSLSTVVVLACLGGLGVLALSGCASDEDKSRPLSVETQSPPAQTSAADLTQTSAPDPARSTTASAATKKPPHVTATRAVSVTTTVRGSGGVPSPAASGPNVRTVVAAEGKALKAATVVHVAGTVVVQGEKFQVDLHLGANGQGTLTSPDGVIRVRRVGKAVFLNVDAAFFALNKHPELAVPYQDKWMPIDPEDPAHAVLLKLTQVGTWSTLMSGAPVTKAAAGSPVNGTRTLALTGGTGSKGTTVLVPATGVPLPLLARSTDGVDQITFAGWNTAPPSVAAPTALKDEPDDAVVDIPAFATETAAAFAKLWVTTPAKGL